MAITLQTFASVADASGALASTGTRYLGGGTLVVRAANEGDISIERLVRVADPALSAITIRDGRATIGAAATMAAVAAHPDLPAIAGAARAVGGPAIRNMATVGGNLFAPAPYGDFTVALLALDATVEIGGEQKSLADFLADQEADRPASIVTSVSFVVPPDGVFRFSKVSRVKPKGVSVLSIAATVETDATGAVSAARIALGCMAQRPMRARAAEEALIGRRLDESGIAPALTAATVGTEPITDPIASAWYRAEVLPVHLRRLLLE